MCYFVEYKLKPRVYFFFTFIAYLQYVNTVLYGTKIESTLRIHAECSTIRGIPYHYSASFAPYDYSITNAPSPDCLDTFFYPIVAAHQQ